MWERSGFRIRARRSTPPLSGLAETALSIDRLKLARLGRSRPQMALSDGTNGEVGRDNEDNSNAMKFCYVDESGMGQELVIVMVGVIVDAQRMHKTKDDWDELLKRLSNRLRREIKEFHTRVFYSGNGPWRDIPGNERSGIIDEIMDWVVERKHKIVCAAVDKTKFEAGKNESKELKALESPWLATAVSLVSKIQREHQREEKNKGHTVFIFDREVKEEGRLTDFLYDPPDWSDRLYDRAKKAAAFDQIVDVPYFADSKTVLLIQVADLFAYLVRRKIETERGYDKERYEGELEKLRSWCDRLDEICLCGWYPGSKGFKPRGTIFYDLLPT